MSKTTAFELKISAFGRVAAGAVIAFLMLLVLPHLALAHQERPSYWPDPAPDTSIDPPAGGDFPTQKPLGSAVTKKNRKDTFVACKGRDGRKSMKILKTSVKKSKRLGFRVRPSVPREKLSNKEAKRYLKINKKLAKMCEFSSIQDAIDAAGNNQRVVIMPGRYPENDARRSPENDPRCADLTQIDTSGRETPSYEYQVTCPHDQNLVYVQGREVGDTPPPEPPLNDRHGIPDLGPCVRCNLQVEGSGPRPVDVVIDAALRGKKRGPAAKPGEPEKDVVFRADRADGIVISNMTLKGAAEHGFYTEETDGYLVDRVKLYWNLDYGNLSFTADYGLFRDCDGFGSGDAVLYPGASPETGEQVDAEFYGEPRINTVIKRCDMRGSALGYSGSMGNAVRITDSDIYGNAVGISADTISASGHPGFPTDSMQIDNNRIFSNNLNPYTQDVGFDPTVGVPVGTGVIWPGMNNGRMHDNYIFDNWRYGSFLIAIPDALVTPENEIEPGVSCPTATPVENPEDNTGQSTSCGNQFFNNHLGITPPGWEAPAGFQRPVSGKKSESFDELFAEGDDQKAIPNGLDFFWDEMPVNTGNCWYDNFGPDGTNDSVTADPPVGPAPGVNEPGTLPDDCANSVGNPVTYPVKAGRLVECSTWSRGDQAEDFEVCDWFSTPPEPGDDREAEPTSAKALFKPTSDPDRLAYRVTRAFSNVAWDAWQQRTE